MSLAAFVDVGSDSCIEEKSRLLWNTCALCRLSVCVCLLQESSRYSSTTYYFSYDMAGVEPHRPWGVDGHGESPMAGRGIGVGWAFGVDLWDV